MIIEVLDPTGVAMLVLICKIRVFKHAKATSRPNINLHLLVHYYSPSICKGGTMERLFLN